MLIKCWHFSEEQDITHKSEKNKLCHPAVQASGVLISAWHDSWNLGENNRRALEIPSGRHRNIYYYQNRERKEFKLDITLETCGWPVRPLNPTMYTECTKWNLIWMIMLGTDFNNASPEPPWDSLLLVNRAWCFQLEQRTALAILALLGCQAICFFFPL